ncbi:MAG: DUF4355 domain-containing protein [Oscillospiraceae bacterium]
MQFEKFKLLQLFAEDSAPAGAAAQDPAQQIPNSPDQGETKPKNEGQGAKYSDSDLDRIITQKMADERKKQDKSTREAQRLATMSDDERMQNELSNTRRQLEELQHQNAIDRMAKVARGILSEKSINLPDNLLLTMVTEDSKETKDNVDSFVKLFDKAVADAVTEKIKGKTPRTGAPASTLTKSDIDKIAGRRERQQAIKDNMNLYLGGK